MSFKNNILKIYSGYKNNGLKSVLKQLGLSITLIPLFLILPFGVVTQIIGATSFPNALVSSLSMIAVYTIYISMLNNDIESFREDKYVSINEVKKYIKGLENKEQKIDFARKIVSEMMIDDHYGIKEVKFKNAQSNKYNEVENINMTDKQIRIYECIVKSLLDEKVIKTKQKEEVIL